MTQNIINACLNTVLVSLPEELFITLMTLVFLKRFDLLDIHLLKKNVKWFLIPAIPVSISINLFRYIITDIPRTAVTVINLIVFYTLIVFIIKKTSNSFQKRNYGKIMLAFSLSFIIWGILESVTCPVMAYMMNKPIEFFNSSFAWNFALSIPSRILAFSLVAFLIIRCNTVVKIKMVDIISKNKFFTRTIICFTIITNVIGVYILKLIIVNRILDSKVSTIEQMIITMGVLIIPALLIFLLLLMISYLLVKEKQIQQTYENLVFQDDIMLDVDNDNEEGVDF